MFIKNLISFFRHKRQDIKSNNNITNQGFTIVELLVVIVVIAILAAISVVSYVGITQKATAATLQSDLKNASTQLEIDKTTNGTYPATKEAANGGKGLQPSPSTNFDYTYTSASDSYSLVATKGDISYHITSEDKTPVAGTPAGGGQDMVLDRISLGNYHTCGIINSQVYCWGNNDGGELGNNTTNESHIPALVDMTGTLAGKTVTAISAGASHTCAIANSQAYCWGSNSNSQLGNNTTTDSLIPVPVDTNGALAGKNVTAIDAGASHTCAIADGQAYCWGYNDLGELGNNTTTNSPIPVPVDINGALAGKTVTAISSSDSHNCAIANNQAYCWGNNQSGQLGNNTTTNSPIPVPVDTNGALAGKTVTAISTGGDSHTCAIANGQAYCWGASWNGELGNGTKDSSSIPVPVDTNGALAGKTVTAIATGDYSICAIADGQAYCWGANWDGELGNNTTVDDSSIPVPVDTNGALAGKTVTAISAGLYHICAIANSKVYCWGDNDYGQFGNDSTEASLVPITASM